VVFITPTNSGVVNCLIRHKQVNMNNEQWVLVHDENLIAPVAGSVNVNIAACDTTNAITAVLEVR
jgi:hypothetical protein